MTMLDDLLTVGDCAVILSVSEVKVREYLQDGLLKGQKLGDGKNGRWRVWAKDLEAFVNGEKNG